MSMRPKMQRCDDCQGLGRKRGLICDTCHGEGEIPVDERF
jgi:DnaJ-class molecular chaperone